MWREWLWRVILVSTAVDAAYLGLLPILSLIGWTEGQAVSSALRARGEYYGLMPVLLLLTSVVARVLMSGMGLNTRARMYALLSLFASAAWVAVVVEEQTWILAEAQAGTWMASTKLRLLISEVASFGLAAIAFTAATLARQADRKEMARRAVRPKAKFARHRHPRPKTDQTSI